MNRDLLKRHACRHAPYGDPKTSRCHPGMVSRVGQACKPCAASKIKCTDSKPCRRCVDKNITCEVECSEEPELSPDRGSADRQSQDTSQQMSNVSALEQLDLPTEIIEPQLAVDSEDVTLLVATSDSTTDSLTFMPSMDSNSTMSCSFAVPLTPTSVLNATDTSELYADFLKGLLNNGASDNMYPPIMSAEDLGVGFWDDYLDANMSLEGTVDVQSLSPPTDINTCTTQTGPEEGKILEQKAFHAAANAFEQSGWNWSPSSQDRRSAEHGGLSLPHDWARQEGIPQPDADFLTKQMGLTDRERVMGLLLTYCSKQHLARMVSTFPSVGSLNGLVHRFLRSQTSGHQSWIHIPTFDPTTSRPELLAAVVADGACSTPVEVMMKLGYAMIDIVRTAVIDNVSTSLCCAARVRSDNFRNSGMATTVYHEICSSYKPYVS